jgi:hypothetical protein
MKALAEHIKVISRKKHPGIPMSKTLLPKELLALQGGGWEGDGGERTDPFAA